ncbi:sigma-70 family RNA polymerase sigma factor [Actinoplanes sp. CA-142083]|uniref:sigma-70 family RNA polymerase sigma factor n=1 Tax=Actinoplanes sp. CA-142083 TaxID=3239903 RepID=UPI003D938648
MVVGVVEDVDELSEFEDVRSVLLGVARHIVGRAADAEDVVQDAWVRWQTADREQVRTPVAFLVTVTRRLALNAATSAYARREVCAGGWLPDLTPAGDEPAREAERGEAVAAAVRLLMERLSPIECAVYLLREAFGHSFREIAGELGLSEANARQLAFRARHRVRQERHHPVDPAERDRLLGAFLRAARAGDTAPLTGLLSAPPSRHVTHRAA